MKDKRKKNILVVGGAGYIGSHMVRVLQDKKYNPIVLDNLSVHKNKKIMDWAGRRRRLNFHFTPTYSSWLNQIEIWFGILTKDVLKGGVWHSKKQLVNQLLEYIKTYNKERAKPFKWTYTGKILVA